MTTKRKKNNSIKPQFSSAILVLENKSVYKGIGLGYQGEATGEICFNTSLTGYQEIISDPSYAGQIINFTFPHIGNVGTNNEDLESDKIWARGVIFNSEITSPSNYRSLKNLDEWLKKNKIVGITGLDTRSLTNFIRDKGAPKGTISDNKRGNFNIKKFHLVLTLIFHQQFVCMKLLLPHNHNWKNILKYFFLCHNLLQQSLVISFYFF